MEIMATSVFFPPKSIKGDNLLKLHYRVMSLGHNVDLMLVNKFIKFDENSLNSIKCGHNFQSP